MSLLLVLALTAGLSAAAGSCLSRRNTGHHLPWTGRAQRFSWGFTVLYFLSGAIGLSWTGDHFLRWSFFGVVAALFAWHLPWWAVQAAHNRQLGEG